MWSKCALITTYSLPSVASLPRSTPARFSLVTCHFFTLFFTRIFAASGKCGSALSALAASRISFTACPLPPRNLSAASGRITSSTFNFAPPPSSSPRKNILGMNLDAAVRDHGTSAVSGLIMRLQRARHRRRSSRDVHCDLPFQIQARKVVVLQFGNREPVPHKHCIRFRRIRQILTGGDERLISKLHRFRPSFPDQFQRRMLLIELRRIEFHRLNVAVRARRLQPRILELLCHIRRGFLVTIASGVASFQFVIGQVPHVRPPALPQRFPIRSRSHRGDSAEQAETQNDFPESPHRILLSEIVEWMVTKPGDCVSRIFFDARSICRRPRSRSAPRRALFPPPRHSLCRAAAIRLSRPPGSRFLRPAELPPPAGKHLRCLFSPAHPPAARSSSPPALPSRWGS